MYAYHFDRSGALQPGQVLVLDSDGLSAHGRHYWEAVSVDSIHSHAIEHIFEEVRLAEFPTCVSRYQSLFACREQDLKEWRSFWGTDYPLYEIKCSGYTLRDSGLLHAFRTDDEGIDCLVPQFARLCARLYWKGDVISPALFRRHPDLPNELRSRMEVMVPLPAEVIRLV